MSAPLVLNVPDWNPKAIKYMVPKVNKSGGKSISMISRQTNRSLYISTPLMMTWGISDFTNEDGVADGKYGISLNFPSADYASKATDEFLQKIKDFENQVLEDAVANSELWWGEEMSHAVCKHTFFPILKYPKDQKKKPDLTKPPSIRAKVPMYDGKWSVEVYDTRNNLLFPSSSNLEVTPVDFVKKLSSVACVLQCGGIWIGGKGWGLTWKLIQCVVKPKEVVSVNGSCHIQLSAEERGQIEAQAPQDDEEYDESSPVLDLPPAKPSAPAVKAVVPPPAPEPEPEPAPAVSSTHVEDSDDEQPSEPAPVAAAAAPVKKVVKKVAPAAAPVAEPEPEAAPAAEAAAAPPKKVVKKVAPKK